MSVLPLASLALSLSFSGQRAPRRGVLGLRLTGGLFVPMVGQLLYFGFSSLRSLELNSAELCAAFQRDYPWARAFFPVRALHYSGFGCVTLIFRGRKRNAFFCPCCSSRHSTFSVVIVIVAVVVVNCFMDKKGTAKLKSFVFDSRILTSEILSFIYFYRDTMRENTFLFILFSYLHCKEVIVACIVAYEVYFVWPCSNLSTRKLE